MVTCFGVVLQHFGWPLPNRCARQETPRDRTAAVRREQSPVKEDGAGSVVEWGHSFPTCTSLEKKFLFFFFDYPKEAKPQQSND